MDPVQNASPTKSRQRRIAVHERHAGFPQCGFSAAVVQILSDLGVKFKAIDVLKDPEIRQGIKEFSNWPTIPQLYVKGEFVGGCDILREMFEPRNLAFSEEALARAECALRATKSPRHRGLFLCTETLSANRIRRSGAAASATA